MLVPVRPVRRPARAPRASSGPCRGLVRSSLLAACSAAPSDSGGDATTGEHCARMVTNSGGLDDRSFNQSSWAGLQAAQADDGIDAQVLVSTSETDLAPNVDPGRRLRLRLRADRRLRARRRHAGAGRRPTPTSTSRSSTRPSRATTSSRSSSTRPRRRTSRATSPPGSRRPARSATFGGGNQPPVTLFMDGFVDGVDAYNAAHGTAVAGARLGQGGPGRLVHRRLRGRQQGQAARAGPHRPGRRRHHAGRRPGRRGRGLRSARRRRRLGDLGRQRRLRHAAGGVPPDPAHRVLKDTEAAVRRSPSRRRRRASRTSRTSAPSRTAGSTSRRSTTWPRRSAPSCRPRSTPCATRSSPAT